MLVNRLIKINIASCNQQEKRRIQFLKKGEISRKEIVISVITLASKKKKKKKKEEEEEKKELHTQLFKSIFYRNTIDRLLLISRGSYTQFWHNPYGSVQPKGRENK